MPKLWGRKNAKKDDKKAKRYSLRMGQLLGPYSVGSIYPCDSNTTVMVAGLDAFNTATMEPVIDSRLARYIGVSRLLAPPVADDNHDGVVPALRFPGWLYCPRCGRMSHYGLLNSSTGIECDNPDCKKGKYGTKLVPERFVVACPRGHIDDFPVMEWVHQGTGPFGKGHVITRSTGGGIATMSDIRYSCTCGAKRTMAGASDTGRLGSFGYSCTARQPWLDRTDPMRCSTKPEDLRVIQMGGTNVCYADVASSVLIPDSLDEKSKAVVDEHFEYLCDMETAGVLDANIAMLAKANKVDIESLRLAYRRRKTEGDESASESDYLHEEYLTLRDPRDLKKGEFLGNSIPIEEYDSPIINDFVSAVSLIDTLTVTRALVGFSRLSPEANEGKSMRERRRMLARASLDWALAIQTKGEGIFIELDGDLVNEWSSRACVRRRFGEMQRHLTEAQRRRRQDKKRLNPAYVTIHTLAHLLMLGVSEVCGYSAASLRERIYCDKYLEQDGSGHKDMHGLLIYTASGSGDGSLGGLVRSGRPGRFEAIIEEALTKALWCSGDPVCMESHGQGLDSCNLAACYNCALVPETSCESGNKFLDRGLLVGSLNDPRTGLLGEALRGSSCQAEARNTKTIPLELDLESGMDCTDMGLAWTCGAVASPSDSQILDSERALLNKLAVRCADISVGSVYSHVEILDEVYASIVCPDIRLVLVSQEDAHQVERTIGPLEDIDKWRFMVLAESSVDDVINAIGGGC